VELYLVRHAIAVDAVPGQSDDSRPLSKEGVEKFQRCVQGLGKLGVELDQLYFSPKLRTVQTAELLGPLLVGEAQATPWLAQPPGEQLLGLLSGERIALVGHEPWIGELCAWLMTGQRGLAFPFKKGGVAHLSGTPRPGQMRLGSFLPPAVMRSI
jgi:phosphohistidine phosphatase